MYVSYKSNLRKTWSESFELVCLEGAHFCKKKQNNKWLKCKKWRPLFITVWALRVTSVLCVLCLNRKCGSDAGWGWLIKDFVITNKCDDITRGGEKKRKRLATLSALRRRESLPGFCLQIRVCFHFHGKQSQKPTNIFVTAMKEFTRRAGKMSSLDKAACEKQLRRFSLKATD